MNMFRSAVLILVLLDFTSSRAQVSASETNSPPAPPFSDIYSLVRSNLAGATDAQLNQAAVLGFLSRLQPEVSLVTNGMKESNGTSAPLLTRTTVFDGAYAYLRVGRVAPDLAKALRTSLDGLRATNKLKGLILDLRFAGGDDYGAAAEAADVFTNTEQPLLQWGDHATRSSPKDTPIDLPDIVLVNGSTTGAAEALAAALRSATGAVLIGGQTAGRAYLFKEFPLSNGQVLRIAGGSIATGDGQRLSSKGLTPDIRVHVSPQDEKAFLQDPYRASGPSVALGKANTNNLLAEQSTNRPRRRLNEAELVRMQRDGTDPDAEPPLVTAGPAAAPVISDPALSRALDLLKGLALALKRP
jgi:hypothetical protein